MTQHPVSAEIRHFVSKHSPSAAQTYGNTGEVFLFEYCIYLQSTHGGGGDDAVFTVSSSTSGPTSLGSGLQVYIFSEVCGRYADDARLICASVTSSTSVVGSHSKLPSSVIILING
jgi:hypothetical protein